MDNVCNHDLSDGVEVAEEGHLASHGLAGRELTVDPEVALVEIRLLARPCGEYFSFFYAPLRIAVFEDDAGIAAVVALSAM